MLVNRAYITCLSGPINESVRYHRSRLPKLDCFMHPLNFFGLFPAFPRKNVIFVAMSFDSRFDKRWEEVIRPAATWTKVDGEPLEALRIDTSDVSDVIMTQVLDGIATCRLVLVDITTVAQIEGTPYRSSNVLYELGLAQATRLPEEVLIYRSDDDPLLFDVAGMRVSHYSPDTSPEEAQRLVAERIYSALQAVDLQRHLAVQRAADALDFDSWMVLCEAYNGTLTHPEERFGKYDETLAIYRMLDLGALMSDPIREGVVQHSGGEFLLEEPPSMRYALTNFGDVLLREATKRARSQPKRVIRQSASGSEA